MSKMKLISTPCVLCKGLEFVEDETPWGIRESPCPDCQSTDDPAPYDIPVVKWADRPMEERVEWEIKAAWNRPGLPEMPQDFVDYVTSRILSTNVKDNRSR